MARTTVELGQFLAECSNPEVISEHESLEAEKVAINREISNLQNKVREINSLAQTCRQDYARRIAKYPVGTSLWSFTHGVVLNITKSEVYMDNLSNVHYETDSGNYSRMSEQELTRKIEKCELTLDVDGRQTVPKSGKFKQISQLTVDSYEYGSNNTYLAQLNNKMFVYFSTSFKLTSERNSNLDPTQIYLSPFHSKRRADRDRIKVKRTDHSEWRRAKKFTYFDITIKGFFATEREFKEYILLSNV